MRVLLILCSCASMGADELITELVLAVQITVYAYRMIQSIKPQLCTHVTNEITQCSGCHNQAIPYAVATSFFNEYTCIQWRRKRGCAGCWHTPLIQSRSHGLLIYIYTMNVEPSCFVVASDVFEPLGSRILTTSE